MYATIRYKNILNKYAHINHKVRLLQELAFWKKIMDFADFWNEMHREAVLRTGVTLRTVTKTPKNKVSDLAISFNASANYGLLKKNKDNNGDNKNNNKGSSSNVKHPFRQYQHKIKTQVADKNSFQAESGLQEILALSNILFLVPNQHSDLKVQVFGCQVIDSLCHATINRFMDNLEVDFSTQEVSDLAAIVDNV